MESRENPIFGRKVFFLNPPLQIENSVLSILKESEYEVYIIRDYRDAKPILAENKDAICFVNVDKQLEMDVWYNFIKSFKYDEKVSSIFLGVISSKIDLTYREKFLMDLKLPGGMILLNEPVNQTALKIEKILEINGAKGRRKYIRLVCKDLENVKGYITVGDKMFFIKINDISSVGFACTYDSAFEPLLIKNSVFREVTLELGNDVRTVSMSLPSVVYDKKNINDQNIAVILFTKEVPSENRAGIRNFIFSVLEKQAEDFMKSSMKDMTDYSEKVDYPEDDFSDIDDLEEL